MKTGIWLDRHGALVIHIDAKNSTTQHVVSSIETRPRYDGEQQNQTRFGNTYLTKELKMERHEAHQRKEFFASIQNLVEKDEDVLLFGPGEERIAFWKYLKTTNDKRKRLHTIVADSMTDPQKVAFVRRYFKMELPRILPTNQPHE